MRFPALRVLITISSVVASGAATSAQGYVIQQFNGVAPGDNFGVSVAGAGDINGDGFDDVIVGSEASPGGLSGAGQAVVFSGADGAVLWTFNGSAFSDTLGRSVDGAGDVNADGVPDLIVGAPRIGSPYLPGYVRVYSGANGAVLHTLSGSAVADRFGESVAGAGDVDGDGFDDVIVGCLEQKGSFSTGPGYARVFSGATGAVLASVAGTAMRTVWHDEFYHVSGAGDVNGDGFDDFIVGGPETTGALPGYARVFAGPSGVLLYHLTAPATALEFGCSVAGAGDVNGDGFDDVIVGDPDAHWQTGGGGEVTVYSGLDGGTLLSFAGSPAEPVGESVGTIGDVDGDGVRDVLTAAQGWTARIHSGASGGLLYTLGTTSARCGFRQVAPAGDVNGDGVADVIVGNHNAGTGGEAVVYSAVGIPAGSSTFGSGCAGTGGIVPRIQTAGGDPDASVGNPRFSIVVSKAPPSAPALLFIGASNTSWAALGVPLPVSLAPIGLTACWLDVSGELQIPTTTTADGIDFVPLPVPANPAFAGQSVYFQWLVFDPPGAMTQGLKLVL